MNSYLRKKPVLITGGGRGIGKAIAHNCAANGAQVFIVARSEQELVKSQMEIYQATGTKVEFIVGDITRLEDLEFIKTEVQKKTSYLYALICAAGVYGSIGPFLETSFANWSEAINTNLMGVAATLHTLVPLINSEQGGGRVILFSGGGQGPMAHFSSYVASKGALWRLTETLAKEFAPKKIFLNSIAPGAVNTKLLDEVINAGPDRAGRDNYEKALKQKQSGGESADRAAQLALFLLSEKSWGLYGKTISAIWDDFEDFKELGELSESDIYTYRRVVPVEGASRA